MCRSKYRSWVLILLLGVLLSVYMGKNILSAAADSSRTCESERMEIIKRTLREQQEEELMRTARESLKRIEAQLDNVKIRLSGIGLPEEAILEEEIPAFEGIISEEEMPLVDEVQPIEYHIELNDVLDISVWQFPELSREVTVRPDGRISFPLIGDMQAAGLTLTRLDDEITKKLSSYAKEQLEDLRLQEYHIELNDVLDISVWQFPELSREVTVRPDGRISFPLIGEVQAAERTPTQLDEEITEKLTPYIKDPQISVIVKKFGSRTEDVILVKEPQVSISIKKLGGRKVIVLGQVKSPGVYSVTGANTILEAIGLAGGFTDHAVSSSVVLIRGGFETPQAKRVNLSQAIKRGDMRQNVALESEDIVFVPKKFIANLNYFLDQVLGPIAKGVFTVREIRAW